jgi:predicted alpha/beta-fold hydrolase
VTSPKLKQPNVIRYTPAWWLPNPHLQTLWGKLAPQRMLHSTRVERIETPDEDFLDIHHLDAAEGAPLLVLLHGLEGTIRSHYIQALLGEARRRNWRAAVLIFRSCGGELNRARRFYHSGETTDLAFALQHLHASFPPSDIVLAGVSLGGNVLLKYLGEQGTGLMPRVKAAVAASVPYDLSRAARYIDRGFSKVYQGRFIRSLKDKALAKLETYPDLVSRESLASARTMLEFDNSFTAPVHGFRDAEDYYSRSSSINWLRNISINTLLLNAVDDPFLPPEVLEDVETIARANPALEVEFTQRGGHVGFVGGRNPFSPVYYLEQRAGDFLARQLGKA